MEELESRLRTNGDAALGDLIGLPETFQLEFKVKSDASTSSLSKDDKRNLGKALSGFSNADGGILIFGVRTDKVGGEDIATELVPIANVRAFQNEVNSLLGEYLRPANPNIETFAIPSSGDAKLGYLALFIGRSDNRPHMSMAPDHQKYFRRSIQGTIPMDHSLVRDQMLASRDAVLVPWISASGGSSNDSSSNIRIVPSLTFGLSNEGLAMASLPFVRIQTSPKLRIEDAGTFPVRKYQHSKEIVSISATRDGVLHVGDRAIFGSFSFESLFVSNILLHAAQSENLDHLISPEYSRFGSKYASSDNRIKGEFETLAVRLTIGAENAVTSVHEFQLSREQLLRVCLYQVRDRYGFSTEVLERLPGIN